MDDKKLRSFITIAQVGSITKASEKLFLSPTALMRQMDALEKELSVDLLIRSTSGCVLTEEGTFFLERAKNILTIIDQTIYDIRNMQGSCSKIRICYGEDYAMTSIDQFCAAYVQSNPSVSFECLSITPTKWIESVVCKKADCAFIVKDFWPQDSLAKVFYTHVYSSHLYCVMSPTHPLSDRAHLSLNDLSCQKLITQRSLMSAFCHLVENFGANVLNLVSPSSSNVLNACQNQLIHITIDLMIPQYYPLICIPLEYPTVSCGFITRRKRFLQLCEFIDFSKKFDLKIWGT